MNLYDPCSQACVARVEWWAESESDLLVVGEGSEEVRPFILYHSGVFGIPEDVREEEWNELALRFVQYMFQKEPKTVKLRIKKY